MNPFVGRSIFWWQVPSILKGNPEGCSALLAESGFDAVYIKVGYYAWRYRPGGSYSRFGNNLTKEMVDALHENGVAVAGWALLHGGVWRWKEADIASEQVNLLGLDGYIWDVESDYDKSDTRVRDAQDTCVRFRDQSDVPMAFCSWAQFKSPSGGTWHPEDMAIKFMEYCDYGMPMVYWPSNSDAAQRLQLSHDDWRRFTDKPIVPIGRAYNGDGGDATAKDMLDFANKAVDLGLPGISWWVWDQAANPRYQGGRIRYALEEINDLLAGEIVDPIVDPIEYPEEPVEYVPTYSFDEFSPVPLRGTGNIAKLIAQYPDGSFEEFFPLGGDEPPPDEPPPDSPEVDWDDRSTWPVYDHANPPTAEDDSPLLYPYIPEDLFAHKVPVTQGVVHRECLHDQDLELYGFKPRVVDWGYNDKEDPNVDAVPETVGNKDTGSIDFTLLREDQQWFVFDLWVRAVRGKLTLTERPTGGYSPTVTGGHMTLDQLIEAWKKFFHTEHIGYADNHTPSRGYACHVTGINRSSTKGGVGLKRLLAGGYCGVEVAERGTLVDFLAFDAAQPAPAPGSIPLSDPRIVWATLCTSTEIQPRPDGKKRWRVSPVNYLKLFAEENTLCKGGLPYPSIGTNGQLTVLKSRTRVVTNGTDRSPYIRR